MSDPGTVWILAPLYIYVPVPFIVPVFTKDPVIVKVPSTSTVPLLVNVEPVGIVMLCPTATYRVCPAAMVDPPKPLLSVPAFLNVIPVCRLVPLNVKVPSPSLVKPPVVFTVAPLTVRVVPEVLMLI